MNHNIRKFVFFPLCTILFLSANLALAQALVADFTPTPSSGATTDDLFIFTDKSTGGPTAWAWEFGDGSTSIKRSPSHTYAAPGNYPVKLIVTDAGGGTANKTISIKVTFPPASTAAALSASFVVGKGNGPLDATFANTSSGPVSSWIWDFGDGNNDQNVVSPPHTYTAAGLYSVRLIIKDSAGQTSSKTIQVTVPVQSAGGPANAKKPIKSAADCWDDTIEYSGDLPKWRTKTFKGEWTVGLAAQVQALKYDFAKKRAGFNSGLGAGVSFRFYQDVKVPGHGEKPIHEIRTECRMSTWKTQEEAWLPKATPLFSISPIIYASQLTSEQDLAVEPAIMLGFFDDIINIGTGFNLTGKNGEVGDVFLLMSIGAGFNW